MLEATGPLISPAFPDCSWEPQTISVHDSDRIILFTDGLIEATSESGEYGIDRLIADVKKNAIPGDVLLDQILQSVRQFVAGRPIHDDLTVVAAYL